jgi:hypothetical protein
MVNLDKKQKETYRQTLLSDKKCESDVHASICLWLARNKIRLIPYILDSIGILLRTYVKFKEINKSDQFMLGDGSLTISTQISFDSKNKQPVFKLAFFR